jgi:large subunit ribosomal protein L30
MICVVRIRGQVKLKNEIAETFRRLRMLQKLNCIFIDEKDSVRMGMLKKLNEYVVFGTVDEAFMKKVIEARGVKDKEGNYKGYCRLHPPRGGFKKSTKYSFNSGEGILGENKDVVKLVERML